MNKNEECNEFLNTLLSCKLEKLQSTKEYVYRKQRRAQIDEILTDNLASEENDLVEEVLFELGLAAEHEAELLYKQGLKDCVWLLKNLGVLA